MIKIYENTKIYLLCLPKIKTGGTELLHQLSYELNNMGFSAVIVYESEQDFPMPREFEKYGNKYLFVKDIELKEEHLLIIPEIMVYKLRTFSTIRKVIWWLSVDNFSTRNGIVSHISSEGLLKTCYHLYKGAVRKRVDIQKIQKNTEKNLVQSYYAKQFLSKYKVKNIEYLSDYLNDTYLDNTVNTNISRNNIVLYNPKKGYNFTKKIINNSLDLKWVPIENLSTDQVRTLLLSSKVYIDFGNHPGKDRFPREAAISGCCIITGRRGAAQYHDDMPIPDFYKFTDIDKNIPLIISKIHECIDHYEAEVKKFLEYRSFIIGEKEKFLDDIKKIFIYDNY